MSEALVTFFLHRLNSLFLQESGTFSGLEDQILVLKSRLSDQKAQIQMFRRKLDDIGYFKGDYEIIRKVGDLILNWLSELTEGIYKADDCIDELIIQLNGRDGSDPMAATITHFRSELEKINACIGELINKLSEIDISNISRVETEDEEEKNKKGSSSVVDKCKQSFDSFFLNYITLPYYLKSCMQFCCTFPKKYYIGKGKLRRLLVAEGLTQERRGEMMEDVAEENINTLVESGMLFLVYDGREYRTSLIVPDPYREFFLHETRMENFFITCASSDSNIPLSTRFLSIHDIHKKIPPKLIKLCLPIRSLFAFGMHCSSPLYWNSLETMFQGLKFLRVLNLEHIEFKKLPEEVGDLIHLKYLGLKHSRLDELPESLNNLRNLQTLDIRWCGRLSALSSGILNLVQLRHLMMFRSVTSVGDTEVKVPSGIGALTNLQTLTGLYAGGGVAIELSSLTQLRKLGIKCFSEDHASETFASIMKMTRLLSLSLEVERDYFEVGKKRNDYKKRNDDENSLLPSLESFSPPPLLQKFHLLGRLQEMPEWISSMENLIDLSLNSSYLPETPTSILQFLPNLKRLRFWKAYQTKHIGREFCKSGGFPNLEVLMIGIPELIEWTELEEGSFPSLKYLQFFDCSRLRTLPEGLQLITTLLELRLFPIHPDLQRKLSSDGGKEYYKIEHIPSFYGSDLHPSMY